MKYALVSEQRQEAQPDLSGECLGCRAPMVAKCGEKRIWHWAHRVKRTCDSWWESEKPWHRLWKDHFPEDWQEIRHPAENGEVHISDVKTDKGWVIEFQHSHLKPDERRARDNFYPKLVWVVDGTRLKKSRSQFSAALKLGTPINANPLVLTVSLEKCELLKEWSDCRAPVFFDFDGINKSRDSVLWCLLPKRPGSAALLAALPYIAFVGLLRGETGDREYGFDEYVRDVSDLISRYLSRGQSQPALQVQNRSPQPHRFQQYGAFNARARRRF